MKQTSPHPFLKHNIIFNRKLNELYVFILSSVVCRKRMFMERNLKIYMLKVYHTLTWNLTLRFSLFVYILTHNCKQKYKSYNSFFVPHTCDVKAIKRSNNTVNPVVKLWQLALSNHWGILPNIIYAPIKRCMYYTHKVWACITDH